MVKTPVLVALLPIIKYTIKPIAEITNIDINGTKPKRNSKTIPLKMPKSCKKGYKGDLYEGLYHWAEVSLRIITQRFTETNIITIKALASLAILTTSKNQITKAITIQVNKIEATGVKYLE